MLMWAYIRMPLRVESEGLIDGIDVIPLYTPAVNQGVKVGLLWKLRK